VWFYGNINGRKRKDLGGKDETVSHGKNKAGRKPRSSSERVELDPTLRAEGSSRGAGARAHMAGPGGEGSSEKKEDERSHSARKPLMVNYL